MTQNNWTVPELVSFCLYQILWNIWVFLIPFTSQIFQSEFHRSCQKIWSSFVKDKAPTCSQCRKQHRLHDSICSSPFPKSLPRFKSNTGMLLLWSEAPRTSFKTNDLVPFFSHTPHQGVMSSSLLQVKILYYCQPKTFSSLTPLPIFHHIFILE